MLSYASLCINWNWPCPSSIRGIRVVLVVAAGFILKLTVGTVNTFGNMAPYIVSYIRELSHPHNLRHIHATTIFAGQVVTHTIMMMLGGFLEEKLGPRAVTLIGGVVMSLGVMLTYWTIAVSFWLTLLTFGLMYGSGRGMISISTTVCVMRWLPKWKGLATGLIYSGYALSPLVFNIVQTAIINPGNLTPDYAPYPNKPNEKYFTQQDLLERVPLTFLILGGVYGVIQFVGSIFLMNPESAEPRPDQASFPNTNHENNGICLNEITHEARGDNNSIQDRSSLPNMESHANSSTDSSDKTPLQMMRSVKFYLLWLMCTLTWTTIDFFSAMYKAYAFEEVTTDDHFLVLTASVATVLNTVGSVFWGLLADKTDSYYALAIYGCFMTSLLFTFYGTSLGGKAMFLIWMCGIQAVMAGGSSIFPKAVIDMFGKTHAGINVGIIFTGNLISGSVATVLPILLIDKIYWFGMFFIMGGLSLIQFLLALIVHCF